jgi:spore maturation protein CgeB
MLAEWTQEHEEILGAEGLAVLYFRSIGEMLEKARWLRDHLDERQRLARAAYQLITGGGHTYRDRLRTILDLHMLRGRSSNESVALESGNVYNPA